MTTPPNPQMLHLFEQRWRPIRADQPLTLLYTSGTTGDPKGVVFSHFNAIFQTVAPTPSCCGPSRSRCSGSCRPAGPRRRAS